MKADRALGIAAILAGILIAFASSHVQLLPGSTAVSARFFPYLLAAILSAGGLTLILWPGAVPARDVVTRILTPSALMVAATFSIYAFTFRYMDFRLGTWLFVLITMWILGARKPLELIITPIAVALITFYLFRYGFTVLLPTWN
ncbi:MAG: tripartite tricarboxylate transporter TctB family protein [Aquisalimonadaceae bacterium]